MKRKFKPLKISPAKRGSGISDVSSNHDKYLAEFVYSRKLPAGKSTAPPSRQCHTPK
jgi:hypothetical protein